MLALLVIIGHSPEMIDGNRSREPLTQIFHTLSLGELAVDGFFLLSGYLIAKSMIESKSLVAFLRRRVLRIFPAYIVAYLLCTLALAPLVGARHDSLFHTFYRMLLLSTPAYSPGQFSGLSMPALNGSMWTIAYEFRFYMLIAMLGISGLLKNSKAMIAITIFVVLFAFAETFIGVESWSNHLDSKLGIEIVVGGIARTARLLSAFLIGACFYSYRAVIWPRLNGRLAAVCAIATIPLMFFWHTAEAAVTILGAVSLFWLAFRANLGPLQRINDSWDVSYGAYLYGWPVGITILWLNRGIDPAALAAVAIPVALVFGAISWWGLERWAKDFGSARARRAPGLAPIAAVVGANSTPRSA